MFVWLKRFYRRKIAKTQFSDEWRTFLFEAVVHYSYLNEDDKRELEQLIKFFIAEKNFEGCGGLVITDEIKVVIAAQACLLVLGLPDFQYAQLHSILVYPSTVTVKARSIGSFSDMPEIVSDQQHILGQASMQGSVVLVWDAVLRGARHPEQGHNVVYHEFAHILDMRDGAADGTPRLAGRNEYGRWVEICTKEFLKLQRQVAKGKKTVLDSYGASHVAEFFSVATELFFDKPIRLQRKIPDLYQVLMEYYNQDTALRERQFREKEKN